MGILKSRLVSFIVIFLSAYLVASCGGSSSSTEENGRDFFRNIDTYSGAENQSILNSNTTGDYLHFLFGYHANRNGLRTIAAFLRTAGEGELPCSNGGTLFFSNNISGSNEGIAQVEFENCDVEGILFNGFAEFEYNQLNEKYYFYRTTISVGNDSYRVSGDIDLTRDGTCGNDISTSNYVQVDINSGVTYKAENILSQSSDSPCQPLGNIEAVISGRIFHSDHGYIDFSTVDTLEYSDLNIPFPDRYGRIQFTGLSSSATFDTLDDYHQQFSSIGLKVYYHSLNIDLDNDGNYDLTANTPVDQFLDKVFLDIRDDDGDGMHNSWEIAYGLDPTSPDDATLNSDFDGFRYSNITEYIFGGKPNDLSSHPINAELSVIANIPDLRLDMHGYPRAGQEIVFSIEVTNPGRYAAINSVFRVRKSSNAVWADSNCDINPVDVDEKICTYAFIDSFVRFPQRLAVITEDPGDVSFTVSVQSDIPDHDLNNNTDSASITVGQRKSNLQLKANVVNGVNVGSSFRQRYSINHYYGPDKALNTTFRLPVPNNLVINSATYTVNSGTPTEVSGNCLVSAEIICLLGEVRQSGATVQAYVDVNMISNVVGFTNLNAYIESDSIELDSSDNSISQQLFSGSSLQTIQDNIIAAQDGDVITILPGSYFGSLDLSGKRIELRGAGPNQSTIWSAGITMTSDSSLTNFRIAGNTNEPLVVLNGNNITIEGNHFDDLTEDNNLDIAISIEPDSSVFIRRNKFSNTSTINLTCTDATIIFKRSFVRDAEDASDFIIENNEFFNSKCSAINTFGYFLNPTGRFQRIVNNTFYSSESPGSRAIHLYNWDVPDVEIITEISNNIFSGFTSSVFSHLIETTVNGNTVLVEPIVNIHDNLLNTDSDYINIVLPGTDTNLSGDPLFVDPLNLDFTLQVGSPAIDTGTDIDAPTIDLLGNARPLDGNNDGLLATDIGAYERVP